jgi:phenol hydroxylase P4 protein
MTVTARSDYVGEPSESADKYGANQIIYLSWDHHLLFAAPFLFFLPSEMTFQQFFDGPLAQILSPDPDAAKIDWATVQWLKGTAAFQPDPDKSLTQNGIRHKDQLRMATPGLNSVCGAA